ncbi:MAG: hypothetical protein KIT11_04040 [Fimbriimonadaceae bacterium]|nr:hypothetical protein [Fimbriimonadaceae bacterium]QYK56933.1 MAG: hypothetical protein KF733_05485 [Fimbriimonadaceae bacterium]
MEPEEPTNESQATTEAYPDPPPANPRELASVVIGTLAVLALLVALVIFTTPYDIKEKSPILETAHISSLIKAEAVKGVAEPSWPTYGEDESKPPGTYRLVNTYSKRERFSVNYYADYDVMVLGKPRKLTVSVSQGELTHASRD